ncbi:MAG: XylR family transcriptional regulator [Opitutales bacterium]|nr:XylR family transcriptional regulator [Opitutales bacterium]
MAVYQINVGVCLHQWSGFHFGISNGLASYIQGKESWNIFMAMPPEGGLESSLAEWTGDGLICSIDSPADAAFVKSLEIPVVNVTGKLAIEGISAVIGDDDLVGGLAARHFLERGFRSFACLGMQDADFAFRREASFGAEVIRNGGFLGHRLEARSLFPMLWKDRLQALRDWLHGMPKPVAVFAVFDTLAHLAIAACHSADLNVPADVAVIGVDNDPSLCQLSNPPISSIGLCLERRGYVAAQLLDRLIAGEPPPTGPLRIPPDNIIARGSTDVYAVPDPGLRKALQFIARQTSASLSVEDVAGAARMSRRSLERKMREALGCTVYEEIRRRRLALAKEKLRTGRQSLTEVALDSGFNNSSDFSKIFRKWEGMTPGDYRRRYGVTRWGECGGGSAGSVAGGCGEVEDLP